MREGFQHGFWAVPLFKRHRSLGDGGPPDRSQVVSEARGEPAAMRPWPRSARGEVRLRLPAREDGGKGVRHRLGFVGSGCEYPPAVVEPAAPPDAHRISSATTPAIRAVGVRKTFRLPHERYTTLRERARHPLSRQTFELLEAVAGVSFEVPPGEFFGVVGKNGSGKSTLLRCLTGIYPPDSGQIAVEGRLAPFIELGVGFNARMTARENVMTNAVLFGLSRREAAARFEDIVAFAELERFVDLELKNYSSGMVLRLAFAITVHVDADVFLYDEVLAVGDAAFQEKCFRHFDRLREEGKTIVFVTHDMDRVRQICDRAMLLHEGRVVALGEAADVAERYEALNAGWEPPPAPAPHPPPATSSHRRSSLLGSDPARFPALTWTLAVSDFKLKYAGTALNWAWAIARPLTLFAGMLVLFTALGRFNAGVSHYPANLLTSVVLWTFFAQVTANSVQSLSKRADVLRKLPFAHLAVPGAALLAGAFDLGINLVVVFAVILGSGISPQAGWLELPILLLLLTMPSPPASRSSSRPSTSATATRTRSGRW